MLDNSLDSIEAGSERDFTADPNWHKQIKDKNKKAALIIGAAVLLFTIVRIVLVYFHVDPELHFYTTGSVSIFDYAVVLIIAALYISAFFFYRRKGDEKNYSAVTHSFVQGTQTLVFSAAIAGCILAVSAVLQIWSMITAGGEQFAALYTRERILDILILITAALSSVYFFSTAARDSDIGTSEIKYSQRYVIISMMPIIWSFLNTFNMFFDMSRSVNSPVRIYELMCFLALSLYFVSETRMIIGRRSIAKYFTFAYIAMLLAALSAIPNLILSSFWIMQSNDSPIMYAAQIAFVLYIYARIYSQLRYGTFGLQYDDSAEEQ